MFMIKLEEIHPRSFGRIKRWSAIHCQCSVAGHDDDVPLRGQDAQHSEGEGNRNRKSGGDHSSLDDRNPYLNPISREIIPSCEFFQRESLSN